MKRVLLTGARGQLGSELTSALRNRSGAGNVVATDIRDDVNTAIIESGPFYKLDCRDGNTVAEIVRKHQIDTIYQLAALLSATAEAAPLKA